MERGEPEKGTEPSKALRTAGAHSEMSQALQRSHPRQPPCYPAGQDDAREPRTEGHTSVLLPHQPAWHGQTDRGCKGTVSHTQVLELKLPQESLLTERAKSQKKHVLLNLQGTEYL